MRILFTFAGGTGHFNPLVPFARAASSAGHDVAFAGRHALVSTVEAAGFSMIPTGQPRSGSRQRIPLREPSAERDDSELRDGFADRLARSRAADLLNVCADWSPDLVVCDEIDFGSMIAAERLGLPYAVVLVIASGSFVRREVVGPPLARLREFYDLPPDPNLTMLSRYLVVSPFPPGFRDPAFPLPATAASFRAGAPVTASSPPFWLTTLPDRPTVYFTLGTEFNVESGDLFHRVLAGLRELPVNVIATVGRDLAPAEFGPQPAHVRVERYVDQAHVLPRCAVSISHGGSGSVLGALQYGVPLVLLPMGADQPRNAARCQALGVGHVLDPMRATPDDIAQAVRAVLNEPAYRQAAGRLRDEIATLPPPASAVPLFECLALEKQPLSADR